MALHIKNDTDNDPQDTALYEIYTVSALNSVTRELIEGSFPLILVEGEISNLARPASGHFYFTLKDASAQVRCAMFRMRSRLLRFKPANGMQVVLRAQVSFYEARGEFQLIAEHMEEAGAGLLRRQFDALKHKLGEEGLFDDSRKQAIPAVPRHIGVITTPTGAAIRDITSVLKRRFPAAQVTVFPVPVQGEGAAKKIADTISSVCQRNDCDVIILARGGGSLEDLWSFNDEQVARAIDKCTLPLVSAIGHETDFTIADFVADVRAATPSAAAELVSPDQNEWLDSLASIHSRLISRIRLTLGHHQQQLLWLTKHLKHPQQRLQAQGQRLDELEQRLIQSQRHLQRHASARLQATLARLVQHSPKQRLRELELRCQSLAKRADTAIQHALVLKSQRLESLGRALDTVSPLATLNRGYSIVKNDRGLIIRSTGGISVGDTVTAQLAKGQLCCTVDQIKE